VEHLRPETSEDTVVTRYVLAHRRHDDRFFMAPEVGVEPTYACEHRRMSRERDELSKLGICFFIREVPHHAAFPA
jgi:hypothetical protein